MSKSVECEFCGASIARDERVALARFNRKGVPGRWICQDCKPFHPIARLKIFCLVRLQRLKARTWGKLAA